MVLVHTVMVLNYATVFMKPQLVSSSFRNRLIYTATATGRSIIRNKQEEQNENYQKHNRPTRITTKCSIIHSDSPPLEST